MKGITIQSIIINFQTMKAGKTYGDWKHATEFAQHKSRKFRLSVRETWPGLTKSRVCAGSKYYNAVTPPRVLSGFTR